MKHILIALLLLSSMNVGATKYIRPFAECRTSGNGTAYACATTPGGVGAISTFAPSTVQSAPTAGELTKTCGDFGPEDADTASVMASVNFANALVKISGNCLAEGGKARSTWDGKGVLARGLDSGSGGYAALEVSDIDFKGFTTHNLLGQNAASKDWYVHDATFDCALASTCIRNLTAGATGWVFQDVYVFNCGEDCFYTINPMTLRRVKGREWSTATATGDFFQSSNGDCNGLVFEDVDAESSTDIKQVVLANSCTGAVNVTVTRGRFVKLGQSTDTSAGIVPLFFDGPSGTVTVRGAYASGGRINLFVSGGASLVAEGNVFGPATLSSVHCGSSTPSCAVRHNTINGAGSKGIEMASAGAGGIAENNAIVGVVGINRGASGTERGNVIMATTPCQASGSDTSCNGTDDTNNTTMGWMGGTLPATMDGYCLKPDSPLIGAGVYLGPGSTGLTSHDLGNPPTVGARKLCKARQYTTRGAN